MAAPAQPVKVFCVDDNHLVVEALKLQFSRSTDVKWHGCAYDADTLLEEVRGNCPDVVLLDIDMPGKDPFEAISDLAGICAHARVVMYSGLVRQDLLDRAIDAGAWGYVAKGDGERALLDAIQDAASGNMAFSPSIRSLHS